MHKQAKGEGSPTGAYRNEGEELSQEVHLLAEDPEQVRQDDLQAAQELLEFR